MKLADLYLLTEAERRRILDVSKGPELPFPENVTIADVFRQRASASPDLRAVVFGDSWLTYRELDEWSDRLAGELVAAHRIGPDQLVALCFGRGIEMTVAIIAVWKAGGAYVPIDPETPDERVRYLLTDTAASVVLCGDVHRVRLEQIAAEGTAVLTADGSLGHAVCDTDTDAVVSGAHGGSLAYVIYTSGTSGKPKGVMIENRAVVNHVSVISDLYGFADKVGEEVMLQALNYVFDGGVVPVVLALLTGNTLLAVPDHLLMESLEYTEYLRDNGVTHMNGTPTFYKHLGFGEVASLRRMVVGGEVLDATCFREMTRSNKVPVFNEYGPTEATISTTSYAVREDDLVIGRPQSNSYVMVLDDALRPVPVGAVGEIFLSGPGLARGYLNLPEETAEKFVRNPFQSEDEKGDIEYGPDGRNARLYRTGDLARWRSDDALEYVGRKDSQIKVRGFRVEPAEIEASLNKFPGVTQSVVLPAESGKRVDHAASATSLIGYYVADGSLNVDEILRYLGRELPSYMVPTRLVHVAVLPMTVNGKLDVKALRALRPEIDGDRQTPNSELEARFRQIVATVIGVEAERIGIDDDLFQLGLNSILVVELISELNSEFDVDISIPSLFLYPTIAELTESSEFDRFRS